MQTDSCKLEVLVKAIDGNFLVLETLQDKQTLYWPLDKIPRPLDIGSTLMIELNKSGTESFSAPKQKQPDIEFHIESSTQSIQADSQTEKEQQMCKMLEELVN